MLRRLLSYCLVLCVFSSLLIGFSVTANAEDDNAYSIRQDSYLIVKDNITDEWFLTFGPNNGTEEKDQHNFPSMSGMYAYSVNPIVRYVWNIFYEKGYPVELDKKNTVTLENFYFAYLIDQQGSMKYIRGVTNTERWYVLVEYVDNTIEEFSMENGELSVTTDSDLSVDLRFEFKPTKNIERIDVYVDSQVGPNVVNAPVNFTMTSYLGEWKGDNKHQFVVEIESEEIGLLSGILGWIQNIWNKMGATLDKVAEIGDYIIQLPVTLWNKFSDGLHQLFVPDSNDIFGKVALFDELLENKLGAIYQIGDILIEKFGALSSTAKQGTIDIPQATINLPNGNNFSFGGYSVKVVPDGFGFIVTSIELAVGVIATLLFANGVRRRYDDFVRS